MKTTIGIAALCLALYSCATQNDIQVEFVNAELVKIDTVYRTSGNEQVLTWRTPNHMQYISYASLDDVFLVGTKYPMMVKR